MVSARRILRFIDVGSEVRRRPLVGMDFLHERGIMARISPTTHEAKGLIARFVGQFVKSQSHQTAPRCNVSLHVLGPSGLPAVKVRCGRSDTDRRWDAKDPVRAGVQAVRAS
jgi:hypothetical protein